MIVMERELTSSEKTSSRYDIYGLAVDSEIPLAGVTALCGDPLTPPDVVVRRAATPTPLLRGRAVAFVPCPLHGADMREYRNEDGTWIWLQGFGTFHVNREADLVCIYPDRSADDGSLGVALAGPILLYVRHQRGLPSLHASAIVTQQGAVGFLGERGQGKSTIAAAFLHRGATLLTDDAIPLVGRSDGVYGWPGPALMKVWDETAHHTLDLTDELPKVVRDVDKKLVALEGRYPLATSAVRMRALYLLDRYDPAVTGQTAISSRQLGQREALFALIRHTSIRAYLLPADDRWTLPVHARLVAQVPVRVLTYPHGFEHQDAVYSHILSELDAA